MPIEIDIAHICLLARLELSEAEQATYKGQLAVILDHAAKVQSLEGAPSVETAHPLGLENVFREDVNRPSLDRDEVLSQAPESHDGFFVAPPALESE